MSWQRPSPQCLSLSECVADNLQSLHKRLTTSSFGKRFFESQLNDGRTSAGVVCQSACAHSQHTVGGGRASGFFSFFRPSEDPRSASFSGVLGKPLSAVEGGKVEVYSATEVDESCRTVLMQNLQCRHVFGDILDRLHAEPRSMLEFVTVCCPQH